MAIKRKQNIYGLKALSKTLRRKSESDSAQSLFPSQGPSPAKQWWESTKKAKPKVSSGICQRSHLPLLHKLPSIICPHDCQLPLGKLCSTVANTWALKFLRHPVQHACAYMHRGRVKVAGQCMNASDFDLEKTNWGWSWQDIHQRQGVMGNSYLQSVSRGIKALLLRLWTWSIMYSHTLHLQYLSISGPLRWLSGSLWLWLWWNCVEIDTAWCWNNQYMRCTVCAGCNEINANKMCCRGIPSLSGDNAGKQQGTAVLHSHVNNNMHAQSNIARVVLPRVSLCRL